MDLPEQPGKVSLHLGLRGNRLELAVSEVLDDAAGGLDPRALVIAEDEQLVLDDRTAGGPAELVLLERRTLHVGQVVFPAIGIQVGVLQKLEQRAVQSHWCPISG